jgi:hypothetical protein
VPEWLAQEAKQRTTGEWRRGGGGDRRGGELEGAGDQAGELGAAASSRRESRAEYRSR